MTKKHVLLVVAILLSLSIFIVPAAVASSEKKVVGVSVMFSHPFFDIMSEGVKDVMGPEGYEVINLVGEFDVQKQIADVDDFIVQKVDAIFIEPFDSKAIRPALEAAQKAGIPVICLDSPAFDEDLIVANVATDNYSAGALAAEDLIAKLGGEGKVVAMYTPGAKSSLDRGTGFVETIEAKAPGIEIVANQSHDGKQENALSIMENILQGQKQIDGVFCSDEMGAFGVIAAFESANRLDEVSIYSVNGAQTEVDMIKANKLTATSAQQPYEVGRLGGQAMLDYLAGKPVDKNVLVPVMFVDANTVESYVPVY